MIRSFPKALPRRSALPLLFAAALLLAPLLAPKAYAADSTKPATSASGATPPATSLAERVTAFDATFFNAFNTCDLAQLERLVSQDLEFFHDLGGTMRSREKFLASVKDNVCAKFTRQLVRPTMEVWPLGKEGAIYSGTHHFCHTGKTGCQGSGRFLHVLEDRNGQLVLIRVVSYDHKELPAAK